MTALRIALLQMSAFGVDQERNLRKGVDYCRRAHALGADIALFPEMWNIGYASYSEEAERDDYDVLNLDARQLALRAEWQARAVGVEEPYVLSFRDLARELGMAIAVTYLEKRAGAPGNSVSLIDRHGHIVFTYAKVHTCEWSGEAACAPGDSFYTGELGTAQGPVQVGAMICYDREFPESARVLMLQGAEIILTPNACDIESHRKAQFRTRAYENMVGVAMANYAAPDCNGHSLAYHPIAFDRQGHSQDTLVVEAGEREGIYVAEFDMDAIREYRGREAWGNAYRKVSRYGTLTSTAVEEPFIRRDARR